MTFYILHLMHFSKDKCCFKIENLVTSYKLPKDYFSKVFCIVILYLQPFQILKWRKVSFQANILDAMKSLQEDFQKSLSKTSSQVEVDQTSASASKPGPSYTRLDPPSTNTVESMDIDYGPALPPHLNSHSRVDDALGINVSSVEEPSRLPSALPKKSQSFRQYVVAPSSASDHYSDHSDEPRPAPSRAKKHTDKSKHKSRSRYLPSSSEEDQSPEARHRSPKPSRKTYSDQDHPQHDPDPPYYREVALTSPLSMQRRWIPSGVSNFQTLGTAFPGL